MTEALQLQAIEPERDTANAFPTLSLIFSTGCEPAAEA